jgi:solute carrier family 8 (sodium/calcium exchanger)
VTRFSGARGRVIIPYKVIEAGAKIGREFEMQEGELMFENNETW